jgi:hypothetical protein
MCGEVSCLPHHHETLAAPEYCRVPAKCQTEKTRNNARHFQNSTARTLKNWHAIFIKFRTMLSLARTVTPILIMHIYNGAAYHNIKRVPPFKREREKS